MKAFNFLSKNLLPLILILFLGVFKASGANFVVTQTNGNQTYCCPGPATANDGSFLGALMAVNAQAAGTSHTISFNIAGTGPFVIDLSNMPNPYTVTNTVSIDGLTQPGSSCSNLQIILSTGSGGYQSLLLTNQTNGMIRGIVFQGYPVTYSGGSGNKIYNCYFNLNAAGTSTAGISVNNLLSFTNSSTNNTVGGTTCALRNVFGALGNVAVNVSNSSGNSIVGNYFGTDVTGLVTAGSGFTGDAIYVTSSSGTKIENNTIAGNVASGVNLITSNSSTISDNKIGIAINGTTKIGTGFTGTAGIVINNSQSVNVDTNTVVGGVYSSANENGQGFGIYSTGTNCSSLNIRGNLIGVQSNGLTASNLGNGRNGIKVSGGASGINILNNIVCNNGIQDNKSNSSGIYIETNGSTISNLIISGNNIGVDKAYSKAGNIFAGLYLRVVSGGSISTVSLTNNVIGDNGNSAPNANLHTGYSSGVAFLDCPNVNATIIGNYIGMTPSGGDIGNYHNGIELANTSGVVVGGTNTSLRNYFGYNKANRYNYDFYSGNTSIAGDLFGGQLMINGGSSNIQVYGNYFGLTPTGTATTQSNAGSNRSTNNGIVVEASSNIKIGGTNSGEPNTITNMGTDGILVITAADFVQVRQNSIYCNGSKGINLNLSSSSYSSKTPGNNSYAAPVITSTTSNTISGTSPSGATIEIFYEDATCARSCSDVNLRQGKTYIATVTATGTNWTYTLPSGTFTSNNLTATATGNCSGGNCETSQFATCNLSCVSTITTGTATVCAGITVTYSTTDATGPYSWVVSGGTINSGQGTQSISVTFNTAGSQSVKLTSGSCTQATYNVTVNPKPAINSTLTGSVCSGVAQNYTIGSTVAGSNFSWSRATVSNITPAGTSGTSNPITETLTNSTSSPIDVTYVLTATASGCSSSSANYVVTVNPKPAIKSTLTGSVCSGAAQNYTISSTVAGSNFSWSRATVSNITPSGTSGTSNPITETLTNSTSSPIDVTYVLTATASGCSSSSANYVVTVNPKPTISISGTNSFCPGGNTTLIASGASTYSWSTGTSGANITVSSSGTYTVTGTDANSCTNTASQTVTVNPAPGTTSISGPTQFCPTGQTGMVYTSTGGSVSSTYTWTVPSGATITSSPVTANSITVSFASGSGGGSITVEETTSAGCAQTSALSINVTPGSKIASITGTPDSTVCLGQTVNLSANSSGSGYTFRWFKDNVFINKTTADISEFPTPEGVYIYAVEVSNGSCKDTAKIHVTINPNPGKPDLTGNQISVCEATKGVPFSVTSSAGSSYVWTTKVNPSSGATIANGQGTSSITMDIGSGLNPELIKLVVVETNTYNCSTPSDTFDIAVNPRPLSTGISGPASVCEASTGLQYSVTNSSSSVTYNWKIPAGTSISSAASDSSSINVDFPATVASGYVKLYQTSSASCSVLKPDSILVTVNTRPITGVVSGLDKLCAGTSGVIYSVPDPGTGISTTWTITAGGSFTSSNGLKDITASFGSGVDTVYISATNTVNSSGCSDLTPSLWKVRLNSNPNTPLLSGADSICSGNLANKYNVVSPDDKAHYTWTLPSGSSFDATAKQDSSTIFINFDSGFTSGVLSVVEVDSNNCSSSTPGIWDIARFNVVGTSSIIPNGNRDICSGGIKLTQIQNLQKGFTVHWSVVPGKGTATFYNSAHDTTTAWGFGADTNLLVLSISDECLNTVTDTVMVKVGASQLNVKATSAADTACLGSSAQIQIEVNGSTATPFTYNWISSDGSLNTITKENPVTVNLITGGWVTYKVDVYDMNGCSTDTILVDSLYGVAPQTLKIPNLITPNGDYKNDCWEITDKNTNDNIIPGSFLEIYNRWGDKVYQNNQYKNGDFCGSILSDGIYFYYLKPTCGIKPEEKGWLQIISNTESSNK